jgi:hypothetical protein
VVGVVRRGGYGQIHIHVVLRHTPALAHAPPSGPPLAHAPAATPPLGALRAQFQDASSRVAEARCPADAPALRARLAALAHDAAAGGVWDDAAAGRAFIEERAGCGRSSRISPPR